MFEYAAFGFVTLKWWTWPIMWSVVMIAVYSAQRLSAWSDRRHEKRNRSLTPEPCVAHMGTDADDYDHWCWLRDGHDGEHRNLWGVPQSDFDAQEDELDREFPPDEELRVICGHAYVRQGQQVACALPPAHDGLHDSEPGTVMAKLCTWNEDGAGNESACWKWEGHDGPHMIQDHTSGDMSER
jgi:hypothetical protein